MLIGIIANITKEDVFSVVSSFTKELKRNKLEYLLTKTLLEDKDKLHLISLEDYNKSNPIKHNYKAKDRIAIIYAEGTILDGKGDPGTIGDELGEGIAERFRLT